MQQNPVDRSVTIDRPMTKSNLFLLACTTTLAVDYPLPPLARSGDGVKRADLNGDGHEDLVVSDKDGFGVYLFVPEDKARKNLEWMAGWTQIMREGAPGDVGALPSLSDPSAKLENGFLTVGGVRISYEELLRVPGPAPRTPSESLKAMRLRSGFTATLVASEPQVMDPVFIDWDEKGRMWVAEMGDYPFAEGEATKDGQVTWKDGTPGEGAGQNLRSGRIRVLEDIDKDGRYEKSTLFLDGLKHVTGFAFWKGGIFIASIPGIFYAKDEDGDGKCDTRDPWFTGFTSGNPQHLVNGFCWGLDGWLHGANGDSGGDIVCVKTGAKVALGTNDFRFDPRSGEFRLETGRTQCGKWRDDFGNWFGNNNSNPGWHYWLPMSYLERHTDVPVRAVRADLTSDRRVFPIGPPIRRLNQMSAVNTLTSGCNAMPYRDTSFGDEGSSVIFVCEPANNLVTRQVLDYSSETITAKRHAADQASEFLASEDRWFRPVMARTGPDGALYVVDMYRLVLEHPEWVPAEMAKRMQLRGGETMGRIWRISKEGEHKTASISLDSSNGWARDTAQRLLLETGSTSDAEKIQQLAKSPSPAIRVQAQFTLQALGLISPKELVQQLRHGWPFVRSTALAAAGADELMPAEKALLDSQAKSGGTKPIVKVPVIENQDPNRQKVVGQYLAAKALTGNAERGRAVFAKAGCVACHRLGALGVEVGPDLTTVASKPSEQLIEAIFDPNRAVEQRNAVTQLTKKDGTIVAGLIAAEAPGSITLRMAGGVEMVVMRAQIKESKTLTTSLMPAGLETLMSVQECADLLAAMRAGR